MAARKREPDKGGKSAIICGRVEELAEFQSARRVQFYIDVRSEVRTRPQTPLIALAFECQLVEAVPMEEHDLHVDKVVTENTIYEGRHRRSQFTAD